MVGRARSRRAAPLPLLSGRDGNRRPRRDQGPPSHHGSRAGAALASPRQCLSRAARARPEQRRCGRTRGGAYSDIARTGSLCAALDEGRCGRNPSPLDRAGERISSMTQETLWTAASLALVPPLGLAVLLCCRGSEPMRLAAMQVTVGIGALFLVALSFVLDQPSSIDVALTFALLGLPATLLFALFFERWL